MTLGEDGPTDNGDFARATGARAFVAGRQTGSDDEAGSEADTGEPEDSDPLEAEFMHALDLDTWTSGERMDHLAARLEREVERAARFEDGMAPRVLKVLEEKLPSAPDRSKESGVYRLSVDDVTRALRNVLFNGLVEACDGTRVAVSTLPMDVVQIGICLTSYLGTGDGGTIGHRLYRQDIMRRNDGAEGEVLDFLARRGRRRTSERWPAPSSATTGSPWPSATCSAAP